MYMNLQTGEYPVTRESVQVANPQASLPVVLTPEDLEVLGFVEVTLLPNPIFDPTTQKTVEGLPRKGLDGWECQAEVVELTPSEVEELVKNSKAHRKSQILFALTDLDQKRIRPLAEGDVDRLATLNATVKKLREELSTL